MNSPDLRARLTKVFKGTGYNPYRAQCGQFTSADNAGGECGTGLVDSMHSFARGSMGSLRERIVLVDRKTGEVLEDVEQELELSEQFTHVASEGSGYTSADLVGERKDGSAIPDGGLLHMHTHPIDQTFSDGDWRIFGGRLAIGEAKVIGPNTEYTLTKTPEFDASHWSTRTPAAIRVAYDKHMEDVFQETVGNSDHPTWINELLHETSVRMSKQFNITYTRTGEEKVLKVEVQKGAPIINDRLTRVFKSKGYNPYRANCGQFTEEGNDGGECATGTSPTGSEASDSGEPETHVSLDGVYLRTDDLKKEDYEKALATLSDETREVAAKLKPPKRILEGVSASYDMTTNTIVANLKNNGMTFKHEYGHHVDKMLFESGSNARSWSAGSMAFRQAFERDRVASRLLSPDSMQALNAAHDLMDKNLFEPTGRRRFDLSNTVYLEDIADALSAGHLTEKYGLYGHGKAYFEGRPNLQHEETFANLFALHGNKEEWKAVEGMVPRTAKVFEDKLKELRKR